MRFGVSQRGAMCLSQVRAPVAPAPADIAPIMHCMHMRSKCDTSRMRASVDDGMVALEGGEFLMGNDGPTAYPADGEGPVRSVALEPFSIDACAVTNERFATFVEGTGHVTEAERFGWSFV
ncbi:MAG: formylglycine-rating enzyme, partial [Thermoleophilaceae bacterium]|nr:formylglycine-rating enzyme [Thermoleophilaceae bacterium]